MTDSTLLRRHYTRTWTFPIDVISVLPSDLLYVWLGTTCTFVRLNRLVRLGRLVEFLQRAESRTNYPNVLRVGILGIVVVLAIHWNACVYYQLSVWIGLGSDGWVYTPAPGTGLADHYFFCVYWSTMLLLTIGEMDHPVCEMMVHPVYSEMDHPVCEMMDHPATSEMDHPVCVMMDHPVFSEVDHPVCVMMVHLVYSEMDHPVCEMMDHPATSEMDHPVCEMMDHPVSSEMDHPVFEMVDHPVSSEMDHPVCEMMDHPVYSEMDQPVCEMMDHPVSSEMDHPVCELECVFMTVDYLLGILIIATVVGGISETIAKTSAERDLFRHRLDNIKNYLSIRHVDDRLERRVITWFDYLWLSGESTVDEEAALDHLPDSIRAEIATCVHASSLRRVAIFRECETGLLTQLVLKLRPSAFGPGDYVCRKGDIGKELYIIKRGQLNVVGDDATTVLATLTDGTVFGEISVLNIAGM